MRRAGAARRSPRGADVGDAPASATPAAGIVAPLGTTLREARERAGLSVRQLATRMGVSPATVLDAEGGGDPRASTLGKYLEALSTLSPHALLGATTPPPAASSAAWEFVRSVLGLSIARLTFTVEIDDEGHRLTSLDAEGVRPADGSLADPSTRRRVVQLLLRGSHAARLEAGRRADELAAGKLVLDDGPFTHELSLAGTGSRRSLTYRRTQRAGAPVAPGAVATGSLALAAPFAEGASLAIEHAVERLVLSVRLTGRLTGGAAANAWPDAPRPGAWTDLQTVTPERPDFLDTLHPVHPVPDAPLGFRASRRARTMSLTVDRPVFGLYYGIGWGDSPAATQPTPPVAAAPISVASPTASAGDAIRVAREHAGLSQRDLATRLGVSPATVALAERGQDLRRSHLLGLLAQLPALAPEALLPAEPRADTGPLTRREAWEYWRLLLGIEADEERKTLVITAEGDAHAVCETLRLRRVRPGGRDMRVRYSSVQALGRRLPTVLKEIEAAVAADARNSGLKARVVARREGRLIHEITVPAELAQVGASYSRRLFNAGFFDPRADPQSAEHFDGAAIVPFHPVRRLRLSVNLPPGRSPRDVVFGVHPRMMLDGPLEAADLGTRLHPEGLETKLDDASRTLELTVEWPLVGFMYDVFWRT